MPTPAPTSEPTPSPTPLPTISLMPTASPTADDTVHLDIAIGMSGDSICSFIVNQSSVIRHIIAKSMTAKDGNATISPKDIVKYEVDGCSSRRRRKLMATQIVTLTLSFSTSLSGSGYLTADGYYDSVTQSLSDAIADIQAAFQTACGCTISVDTIKVALSTRWAPQDTTYNEPAQEIPATYYAGADCPNACSGHGSCSTDGCVCWSHWGNGDETGGACDQRKCPYEIAWVDTPSAENKAHALRECAGRGVCDRETGDCMCFPGYTGVGCRRTTCPNDCSGHGTCEYLAEMRNDVGDNFKWTGSARSRNQYDFEFPLLWDAHKTRGCVCDPKYTGLDCSIRMCPRGDYANYYKLEKRPETQAVIITNVFTPGTDGDDDQGYKYSTSNDGTDQNGEFALTFRSTLNEEFTTKTLNAYNLTESVVEDALNSLPNKVIEEASVVLYRNLSKYNSTTSLGSTDLVILITFNGAMTAGDQYALECRSAYCGSGCQPKIEHPIDFKVGSECMVVNNYQDSIAQNWECSGRGECGEFGVCECYEGYTDEFCSTKTAII
jgi:hypothetical protein